MKQFFKLTLLTLSTLITSVNASEITVMPVDETHSYIKIEGTIIHDDVKKFDDIVDKLKNKNNHIEAVYLNARDYETTGSAMISSIVLDNDLTTVVLNDRACVGGCFYIFEAGAKRVSYSDSLIAVHRLTLEGEDTLSSKLLSLFAIKGLVILDTPYSVIFKMITHSHTKPYYLTNDEKLKISTDWNSTYYYELFTKKEQEQELQNLIKEFDLKNNKEKE